MSLLGPRLIKNVPYHAQRQSLSGLGSTRHASLLSGGAGVREAEDAASAADDHPGGHGLGGRGEEASSAPITVNPEQMRALVPGGSHHEYPSITMILNSVTENFRK